MVTNMTKISALTPEHKTNNKHDKYPGLSSKHLNIDSLTSRKISPPTSH